MPTAAHVTLTFAAQVIEPSIPDQLPTGVHGVCYSGSVIQNYNAMGDCIIDLASVQFAPNIFLLLNHSVDQRVGRATLAVVDNQLLMTGQFSKVTPAGQQVAAEFAEGAPWQMSVGIAADLEYSPDKMTRTINGQDVAVNAVFSNPRVLEVSLVPAGADPHTAAAAFSAVTDSLFSPSEDAMSAPTPPIDTAEIDRLAAENEALKTELSALQAQMKAARAKEIDALFAAWGTTPSADERQQWIDLPAPAFALVANCLRERVKLSAPAHLFSVQTAGNGGTTPGQVQIPTPNEIYEQRRKAAAKARGGA